MIGRIPINRREGDRSAAIVQRYSQRDGRALCYGDGYGQPEAGLNGSHGIPRGRGTVAGQGCSDIPSRGPLRLKAKRPIGWRFAVLVQFHAALSHGRGENLGDCQAVTVGNQQTKPAADCDGLGQG